MKKLLFISKNLEIGGMEKALVILLNSLIDKYEITLILEERKGTLITDLDSRIKIEEYQLSNWKIPIFRKAYNFIHKNWWKLKNKNKYDFSCNYATYSLIGSYLARQGSVNNSLYVHSDYYEVFEHSKQKYVNFFDSLSVSKFQKIIFVSCESCKAFIEIYKGLNLQTVVINNLIDYKNILKYSQEDLKLPYKKDKINYLFLGRLDNDSKNFKRMLQSFSLALKSNKNINLYLVGNGKDRFLIESLISKYNLNNYIYMIDAVKNPYPYIKHCDCVLLTSNYEGFPLVVVEALVLNKSIISTISVKDNEINLEDYVKKVSFNVEEIAQVLANYKKENLNYHIDYKKINKKRVNDLIKLIENI